MTKREIEDRLREILLDGGALRFSDGRFSLSGGRHVGVGECLQDAIFNHDAKVMIEDSRVFERHRPCRK